MSRTRGSGERAVMDQRVAQEYAAHRHQQLRSLERDYRSGGVCALYDALLHVIDAPYQPDGAEPDPWREVSVPVWVLDAAAACVGLAARVPTRGRRGSPASRAVDRWKDFVRWDTVMDIRRVQAEYRDASRVYDQMLTAKTITRTTHADLCRRRRNPGQTLLEAFGHASDQLAGTVAAGGADAIEKSYKRVQKYGGVRVPSYEAQRRVMGIADP